MYATDSWIINVLGKYFPLSPMVKHDAQKQQNQMTTL